MRSSFKTMNNQKHDNTKYNYKYNKPGYPATKSRHSLRLYIIAVKLTEEFKELSLRGVQHGRRGNLILGGLT